MQPNFSQDIQMSR